jgi:hypothetical protein
VGVSILGIAAVYSIVERGRETKEKAEDRLFDARGVGLSKFTKLGGGTGRAIAAVAGATGAIGLNAILPMRG